LDCQQKQAQNHNNPKQGKSAGSSLLWRQDAHSCPLTQAPCSVSNPRPREIFVKLWLDDVSKIGGGFLAAQLRLERLGTIHGNSHSLKQNPQKTVRLLRIGTELAPVSTGQSA
jgi:hypothetical protein